MPDARLPWSLRLALYLHRLLLSLWLGGLFFFGAIFTPALFRVLTSEQSGLVVRETLPRLERAGLIFGLLLLLLGWAVERRRGGLRAFLLLGMLACGAVSLGFLSPRIEQVRREAGVSVSSLPREHPTRQAFGRLHGASTLLFLGQLLFGLGVLALPLKPKTQS